MMEIDDGAIQMPKENGDFVLENEDQHMGSLEEQSIENQMNQLQRQNEAQAVDVSSRLDQIVADYRRVQSASSGEIERKRNAVRSKCQERLWTAAVCRDYQLDLAKKSFEAEIKQIEREYQGEFNALRDALMQELQEERKRLQALEQAQMNASAANLAIDKAGNLSVLDGGASGAAAADASVANSADESGLTASGGRKLRKREEKASGLAISEPSVSVSVASSSINGSNGSSFQSSTAASRRKQPASIYTYNTQLAEQDILDDLGLIAKEAGLSILPSRRAATLKSSKDPSGASAPTTGPPFNSTNSPNISVSFEKGVLHYNWDIYGPGDRLRIQMSSNTAPVLALITSCSATELSVTLLSGSGNGRSLNVAVNDLKSGKIVLMSENVDLHHDS